MSVVVSCCGFGGSADSWDYGVVLGIEEPWSRWFVFVSDSGPGSDSRVGRLALLVIQASRVGVLHCFINTKWIQSTTLSRSSLTQHGCSLITWILKGVKSNTS